MVQPDFQFDRPGENGLFGVRLSEGALTSIDVMEAVVDQLRDARLANYDPGEQLARHTDAPVR